MPASFLKKMLAGLLLAFACAWIFIACDQLPVPIIKPSDTAEFSQAGSRQVVQSPLVSPDLATAIERVADIAIPAVVHIVVKEHQEMANPFLQYRDNPFFQHFFGLPKDMPKKLERELIGIGTGVIIDAEGHILSNYHVVGGATQIEVTLSDGTQYPATVVGVDPKTDLGVIKINAGKAVAAEVKRRLGVVVRPLTAKETEDCGLSLPEGVAIQWVDPRGPIGKAGFEVGDVILALNDHPFQGVDSFNELMTAIPHHQKVVLLAISHRTGQSGYVQVEIL
jgi:S1-C subfamily serine protease